MNNISEEFNCKFCVKSFNSKEVYENHCVACEFFYNDRNRDIESVEKLPSPQEMFHLVQHLSLQCKILTDEVNTLKINNTYRIKKDPMDFLKKAPFPIQLYDDWYKNFQVNINHLEEVFENNLTNGIKKCLNDRIISEGLCSIPIRTFKEKSGVLYIFTNDGDKKSWVICSNDKFGIMIDFIGHEMTRAFCEWQEEQNTSIDYDRQVAYLVKISGFKINKDRQKTDLKSWLCQNYK